MTRHAGSGEAQRNSRHGWHLVLRTAIFQGSNDRLNTRVEFYATYFQYMALDTIPLLFWGDRSHLTIFASIPLNYVGSPPSIQVILRAKKQCITWHVRVLNVAISIAVDFIAIIHCCSSIDL